jgi:hypothetical protein
MKQRNNNNEELSAGAISASLRLNHMTAQLIKIYCRSVMLLAVFSAQTEGATRGVHSSTFAIPAMFVEASRTTSLMRPREDQRTNERHYVEENSDSLGRSARFGLARQR